jgi:hypothetical protein
MKPQEIAPESVGEEVDSPITSIAFVGLSELQKDLYRGGALVTDSFGKPLEFRCTSAIRPTAVQKTLYGASLLPHICVELAAKPLLTSLSEEFDAVFITQVDFMEVRTSIDKPLVFVEKQGTTIAAAHMSEAETQSELISSASGKYQPIIASCHRGYQDDIRGLRHSLELLLARFDIVEPFFRIASALELINEKGGAAKP